MNASPVAAMVRGWVDLYTRGMPGELRSARRDEVDDDLWCQHEEADAVGRSPRSLGTEMFLRLLLGMPADLSWRLTHARSSAPDPERSSSMGTRILGALAVLGGVSWVIPAILVLTVGSPVVTGIFDAPFVTTMGVVGGLAFAATTIGLAWRFQDQVSAAGAVAGVLAGLGVLFGILGAYAAFLLFPVGSAALIWNLGRTGILSRLMSIVHLASAIGLLAPLIGILGDYRGTASSWLMVGLAIPYMLTWVAIGASLLRGVPQTHQPAPSA